MLVDDSNIFSDPAFRGSDLQPEPSDAEPDASPESEKFQWVNRATLRMLEQLALEPSIDGDGGSDDGSDRGGLSPPGRAAPPTANDLHTAPPFRSRVATFGELARLPRPSSAEPLLNLGSRMAHEMRRSRAQHGVTAVVSDSLLAASQPRTLLELRRRRDGDAASALDADVIWWGDVADAAAASGTSASRQRLLELEASLRDEETAAAAADGGAPSAAERFAADHRQKGLRSISLLLEMEDQPGTSPAAFEAALNELRWHRYHAREWASGARSVQVRLAED